MTKLETKRPKFENPPVHEVVIGYQFENLRVLSTVHTGLFAGYLRDKFPSFRVVPRLQPIADPLSASNQSSILIDTSGLAEPDRLWLISEDQSRLMQFQRDRFLVNWRKTSADSAYPLFEDVLKFFQESHQDFLNWLKKEELEEPVPAICEVTYSNIIPAGNVEEPLEIGSILKFWSDDIFHNNRTLEIADLDFTEPFFIDGDRRGKLICRVKTQSAINGDRRVLLELTVQGVPIDVDIKGLSQFFTDAKHRIVTRFVDYTTDERHKEWGRIKSDA